MSYDKEVEEFADAVSVLMNLKSIAQPSSKLWTEEEIEKGIGNKMFYVMSDPREVGIIRIFCHRQQKKRISRFLINNGYKFIPMGAIVKVFTTGHSELKRMIKDQDVYVSGTREVFDPFNNRYIPYLKLRHPSSW